MAVTLPLPAQLGIALVLLGSSFYTYVAIREGERRRQQQQAKTVIPMTVAAPRKHLLTQCYHSVSISRLPYVPRTMMHASFRLLACLMVLPAAANKAEGGETQ